MKKMKKLLAFALALTMAVGMSACGSSSKATEAPAAEGADQNQAASFTTVAEGELHMATNAAFPPYEMVSDDGGFEGIDVEIAEAIAAKLGLELVVDDMDFSSVIVAVQQGKADIAMAGLTVTEERKENVDFTESYATGIQVVIVPEDSDIASIDDLEGKQIGCQEGTTGYIYCSDIPENGGYGEENVTAYTNGANAVQALLTGKVDCVVIDSEPAKQYVAQNEGLKILETEFTVEDYAIGVGKDNPELLDAVNSALKELIDDGSVQKIVDSYINTNE
ncbi:MAG: ABC transporter substrate-binding protein [Clostridiales bacterium]|nr:ABC transporter substrate-binding protein [Clostridiales bacterium]